MWNNLLAAFRNQAHVWFLACCGVTNPVPPKEEGGRLDILPSYHLGTPLGELCDFLRVRCRLTFTNYAAHALSFRLSPSRGISRLFQTTRVSRWRLTVSGRAGYRCRYRAKTGLLLPAVGPLPWAGCSTTATRTLFPSLETLRRLLLRCLLLKRTAALHCYVSRQAGILAHYLLTEQTGGNCSYRRPNAHTVGVLGVA